MVQTSFILQFYFAVAAPAMLSVQLKPWLHSPVDVIQ